MTRLHLDTDPGLDDLLAIALALALDDPVRVCGLTTVAGNASLDAVTRNAASFLELGGADVPLGRGAAEPLSLARVDATQVHGEDGRQGIPLPEPGPCGVRRAADVMRDSRASGADAVVALGPLTNVAALLRQDPGALAGCELVWMGGTLGAGNATPLAEFNAWADPEALSVVLASDVPLRVIGLDVTRDVWLGPGEVEAGLFGRDTLGTFLERALLALMRAEGDLRGEPRATLHDPCAVVAAVFPELFRFEERRLEVRVEEGGGRGRLVESGAARPVSFAVEAQRDEITRLLLGRLAAWGERRSAGRGES